MRTGGTLPLPQFAREALSHVASCCIGRGCPQFIFISDPWHAEVDVSTNGKKQLQVHGIAGRVNPIACVSAFCFCCCWWWWWLLLQLLLFRMGPQILFTATQEMRFPVDTSSPCGTASARARFRPEVLCRELQCASVQCCVKVPLKYPPYLLFNCSLKPQTCK